MGKTKSNVSVGAILIIVGAILAAASLFMGYVTIETDVVLDWISESVTGMDVITGGEDGTDNYSFVHWAPLLVVIFAVIGAIMAIIPMFAKISVDKKVYSLIIAIVMVISVVFAIVFVAMGAGEGLYTGDAAKIVEFALERGTTKMSLGIGAFVGLIGAIVGLVGAGINVKENL